MTAKLSLKKPLSFEQQARIHQFRESTLEQELVQFAQESQPSRKDIIKEGVAWLSTTYPAAFNPAESIPLQIGIEKTIHAQGIWLHSRKLLREAITFYTGSPHYLKAMLHCTHRVALDGTQAEEITEKQKEYAAERLKKLKAKKAALKKQGGDFRQKKSSFKPKPNIHGEQK